MDNRSMWRINCEQEVILVPNVYARCHSPYSPVYLEAAVPLMSVTSWPRPGLHASAMFPFALLRRILLPPAQQNSAAAQSAVLVPKGELQKCDVPVTLVNRPVGVRCKRAVSEEPQSPAQVRHQRQGQLPAQQSHLCQWHRQRTRSMPTPATRISKEQWIFWSLLHSVMVIDFYIDWWEKSPINRNKTSYWIRTY